jgi:hypothetical protein
MTKSMKVMTLAFLAQVLFAGLLFAQTNPEKPKFTIIIRAGNPEVISGSNVEIWIKTTNISEELIPMQFGEHGNLPDGFRYDIRDEQGAEVAKTVFNDIRPSRGPGSHRPGQLAPGESTEARALISDVYPLDRPGKYTIRAWMRAVDVLDDSESNRVYSNTITITVLPAGSKPATDESQPTQQ